MLLRQLGGEPSDATALANRIAEGDLTGTIKVKAGDTKSLMASMGRMSETIRSLIGEMNHAATEHDKGEIDVRIDESKFQGSFRTVAKGTNDWVYSHVDMVLKLNACIKEFSEGKRTCIVIVETGGRDDTAPKCQMGIVVDSVSEVLEIPASEVEPAPEFGANVRIDFISGMGKVGGKFVVILEADRILSLDEIAIVSAFEKKESSSQ